VNNPHSTCDDDSTPSQQQGDRASAIHLCTGQHPTRHDPKGL